MVDADALAERLEAQRWRLNSVAYRALGSRVEAEDAVQETWGRLGRADTSAVQNLSAWLITVPSRVCLSMLQARRSRREVLGDEGGDPAVSPSGGGPNPETEALVADSIGAALMVVLDTRSPAERLASVLHDVFGVPYQVIAPIIGPRPSASRQLASRARRRVRNEGAGADVDGIRQADLVDAFLAAARDGDFQALVALLDPDALPGADGTAVRLGAAKETRGAVEVAKFCTRPLGARRAIVNGTAGLVWLPGGRPKVVYTLGVEQNRIVAVGLTADPQRLAELELVLLDG